jgi:hypothetical protein
MKTRYSLEQAKASLDSDVGYEFYLSRSFEKVRAVGGLASSAHSYICSAVKCFLVDYNEAGERLLQRAEEWLQVAIDENECPREYIPNGTEATRFYDLALCRWLAHKVHETDLLQSSIDFRERYFASAKVDRVELTLVVSQYADADRLDLAWQHAKRLWKSENLPLEIRAAAAVAEGKSGEAIGDDLERLLKSRVPEWLSRGVYDLAASWLKLAYWLPNQSRSPIDVIAEALKLT